MNPLLLVDLVSYFIDLWCSCSLTRSSVAYNLVYLLQVGTYISSVFPLPWCWLRNSGLHLPHPSWCCVFTLVPLLTDLYDIPHLNYDPCSLWYVTWRTLDSPCWNIIMLGRKYIPVFTFQLLKLHLACRNLGGGTRCKWASLDIYHIDL